MTITRIELTPADEKAKLAEDPEPHGWEVAPPSDKMTIDLGVD